MSWKEALTHDPTPALLASRSGALRYFARRDLMGLEVGPAEQLWESPDIRRIFGLQRKEGSWRFHGGKEHLRSDEDYDQLETYRVLRVLIEEFGINREHPGLGRAAEFMFSHQSDEGDFRGICGRQYVPYYSGAIMEILIKAGYERDSRIKKGFRWLTSVRQDDGGWAFPLRTVGMKLGPETFRSRTLQPDRSKPFSHLITGMVLRAFAAHPSYRRSREARVAGELLATRFFKADSYPDRRAISFWTSFSFPFWFTDLLSSLDSLSFVGAGIGNPQVARGVRWFIRRQSKTGLWNLRLRIMARQEEPYRWMTLAISRVLKRLLS